MSNSLKGKALIFSAPSGSGKSTIAHRLIQRFPQISFSVSATTRPPRGAEQHGIDYYFLTVDDFREKIDKDEFLEFEEVYPGKFYGTLYNELVRIWEKDQLVIFDVDVVGGTHIKEKLAGSAISFFIKTKSIDVLRERLLKRQTDTSEDIEIRVAKAEKELEYEDKFDHIIINDDLDRAVEECSEIITKFMIS